MPTVPRYGPRQVSSSPLPTVRNHNAPTPEMYGAGIGAQLANFGLGLVGERMAAARDRADQVRIRDADLAVMEFIARRKNDPRDGWATKKGADALGLSDDVETEFKAEADRIRKTLSGPRQLDAFEKIVGVRRVQELEWALGYQTQQMTAHDAEQQEKFVELETANAIANFDQPRAVGASLERVGAAIDAWGDRNGYAPVVIQAQKLLATTAVHTGVIDRYLATGKDQDAAAYYEEVKAEIRGDQRAHVEKALELGSTRAESQRAADAILMTAPSKTAALEAIRTIKDPKLRDAVEDRVVRGYNLREDANREQTEQTMLSAANQIDEGGIDAVPASVLSNLSISDRTELERYAARKAGGADVETDLTTYYGLRKMALEQPGKFAKTNLLEHLSKIGRVEFKELTDIQVSIRKGDKPKAAAALDDFRTENQVITQSLAVHGIATDNSDEGKANAPAVARLYRLVADRTQQLQRNTGKKAQNADVQGIVDDILAQSKTTPGSFWGGITGQTAFNPSTKRLIDTTIADVPAHDRGQIEAALRKAGRPVTNETIVDLYIDAQSRRRAR